MEVGKLDVVDGFELWEAWLGIGGVGGDVCGGEMGDVPLYILVGTNDDKCRNEDGVDY